MSSTWSRPCGRGAAVVLALAGVALLWLVAAPRFGAFGAEPSPVLFEYTTSTGREMTGLTVDMREYLHATEYYAGTGDAPTIAPFSNRVAVPFVAGLLPWDAPVSLNLVVLAALSIGLVALVAAWRRLGLALGPMVVGTLGFSVAFPVFYWGSFNYVDGAVVGLLAVLLAALVFEQPVVAIVVLLAAVFTKEAGLVGLPVIVVWSFLGATSRATKWALSAGAAVASVAGLVLAQVLAPRATEFYNPWLPTLSDMHDYFGNNVGRPGPMGQVVLTAVVPAALTLFAWNRRRNGLIDLDPRLFWTLSVGVVAGVLLNIQALLTAQWDGRTLWTIYPFALTLGAAALTRRAQRPADEPSTLDAAS
ncbi:hypothetical protein BH10ACT3_BH10ACT3_12440 [soil metagenome]